MTAMKALSILTNVLLTMWQRAELSGLKNKYTRCPRSSGAEVKCPECGAWTRVLETRVRPSGETRRRYECANEHRITTSETPVLIDKVAPKAGRPKRK